MLLFAVSPETATAIGVNGEHAVLPDDLEPAGWVGIADELRPNLKETLDGLRAAHVELKIISGDNPEDRGRAGSPGRLAERRGACLRD